MLQAVVAAAVLGTAPTSFADEPLPDAVLKEIGAKHKVTKSKQGANGPFLVLSTVRPNPAAVPPIASLVAPKSLGMEYEVCVEVKNVGAASSGAAAVVHFEALRNHKLSGWSNPSAQDKAIGPITANGYARVCTAARLDGLVPNLPMSQQPRFIAWVQGEANDGKGILLKPDYTAVAKGVPAAPKPMLGFTSASGTKSFTICGVVRNGADAVSKAAVVHVAAKPKGGPAYWTSQVSLPAIPAHGQQPICSGVVPAPPNWAATFWSDMVVAARDQFLVELTLAGAPNDGSSVAISGFDWYPESTSF